MKLIHGLVAACVLMGATPAFAEREEGARRFQGMGDDAVVRMVERHMGMLLQVVNATPEQKTKINDIREKHMAATKDMRKSLAEKRMELFKQVKGSAGTRDRAQALQREVSTLQHQLADARLNAWFDARAVLTPEQLKKIETMGKGKHKRLRKHREDR